MKKKKRYIYYIFGIILLLITLVAAAYPSVSNALAQRAHTEAIRTYDQEVEEKDYGDIWSQVEDYNKRLSSKALTFNSGEPHSPEYEKLLDIDGHGMMGYIEIPSIRVKLPIYHGTADAELCIGVGHLEGSSLPAGTVGSHVVLSGHSGYPRAVLFDNLNKLKEGDTFTITVLDRCLTYVVDSIQVVVPSNTSTLFIDPQKDYVTLVTCTPYGVNSHRLLVRGVRV